MTAPIFAVHCRPRGAETRPLPDGALTTYLLYAPTVPVDGISATRALLPGNRVLPPQRHRTAETALVVLSGYPAVLSGPTMAPIRPAPGDLVYIPTNVPYAVINLSRNAAALMLVLTTDPRFDVGATPAPEHSGAVADRAVALRGEHLDRINQRRTSSVRRRR